MKKEELFDDEFLKQFKTGDELNGFLKELQKSGIEKMIVCKHPLFSTYLK